MSSMQDVNIYQIMPSGQKSWIGRIDGVSEFEVSAMVTSAECWHLYGPSANGGRKYLAGFRAAGLTHDWPNPKVQEEANVNA